MRHGRPNDLPRPVIPTLPPSFPRGRHSSHGRGAFHRDRSPGCGKREKAPPFARARACDVSVFVRVKAFSSDVQTVRALPSPWRRGRRGLGRKGKEGWAGSPKSADQAPRACLKHTRDDQSKIAAGISAGHRRGAHASMLPAPILSRTASRGVLQPAERHPQPRHRGMRDPPARE